MKSSLIVDGQTSNCGHSSQTWQECLPSHWRLNCANFPEMFVCLALLTSNSISMTLKMFPSFLKALFEKKEFLMYYRNKIQFWRTVYLPEFFFWKGKRIRLKELCVASLNWVNYSSPVFYGMITPTWVFLHAKNFSGQIDLAYARAK
jgi:hypothetical protein